MGPDIQPNIETLPSLVEVLRERLAQDDSLPAERLLAEQLQVKRHQLRRALELLRASGELRPLEMRRRPAPWRASEALIRGTNPIEVIELRLVIEPALARLAALRATPFLMMQIERAATTPANEEIGKADLAFHVLVASASGNALAAELYTLLRAVGRDARLRVQASRPSCPNRLRQRDAEHRAIAAAIAVRDPGAAESAMRTHLQAVQRQVLAGMNAASNVA